MYERFYQFRERPFALSPDPDYLYPSRVHRTALDYLRYGIEGYAGFVVITGEIGSGKTTLLQALLRHLDDRTTVARLMNTILEPRELLEAILVDLGAESLPSSKAMLVRDLARTLLEERSRERRVLLVIDEAQNLPFASLEEVRMLSNLETEKSKLLQIVLVGQPELRDTLALPELQQLRQRITVSYHIQPLDVVETAAYINHRLQRASLGAPLEFSRDVTDLIYARSRGVPRMINVICDSALFFGYAEGRRVIDTSLMKDVFAELEETQVLRPPGSAAPPSGEDGGSGRLPERPARGEAPAGERPRQVGPVQRTGAAPGRSGASPRVPASAPHVRQERAGLVRTANRAAEVSRPAALPATQAPPRAAAARPAPAPRPALVPATAGGVAHEAVFGRLIWSPQPGWLPPKPVSLWQRVKRLILGSGR